MELLQRGQAHAVIHIGVLRALGIVERMLPRFLAVLLLLRFFI